MAIICFGIFILVIVVCTVEISDGKNIVQLEPSGPRKIDNCCSGMGGILVMTLQ